MIETISRTGYAFLRYLATRLLRIDLMLLALVVTLTTDPASSRSSPPATASRGASRDRFATSPSQASSCSSCPAFP